MAEPLTFGAALGNAFAGAIASGIGSQIFGGRSAPTGLSTEDKEWQRNMLQLGNKEDLRNQNLAYDHRITRMKEHGLTPVEMFGSPGSAPGGGTTGSGAVLGNAAQRQGEIASQQKFEADQNIKMKMMDNFTALSQTKMQTDAQKDIAGVSADTQIRGQDINKEIADNILKLDGEKLALEAKKAAVIANKTEHEVKVLKNEIVTSSPKYNMAMKQLSMGPANLLVELTLRNHGISLSDDSFMKLPEAKREEILDQLLALSSNVYVETKGASALGKDAAESSVVDATTKTMVDLVIDTLQGVIGGGIEQTDAPPNLHMGPTSSESYQPGPNMNYR